MTRLPSRTASALQPLEQTRPCRLQQLELHRPAAFLLDDDGALADPGATHEFTDPHLDKIAATQLAVDSQVQEGAISETMLLF
jgi:hypothetical protein